MGEAIGQVLSLGVGVALSPVPIIAVVLMLATPRGGSDGAAFLLGWGMVRLTRAARGEPVGRRRRRPGTTGRAATAV